MKTCKGPGCYCEDCVAKACEHVTKAEEHKADPKMMALVADHMNEKVIPGKIKSLKELKKLAAKRMKQIDEEMMSGEEPEDDYEEEDEDESPKMVHGKTKPREEVVVNKFKGPQSNQEKELRKSPNHEYADKIKS